MPFAAAADGQPPVIPLDDAECSLVVVLVDERMTRRVPDPAPARAWADLVVALLAAAPPGRGPHAVLPVAVDAGAFDLDPHRLGEVSFVRLDAVAPEARGERLLFHVAAAALQLLDHDVPTVASSAKAPVNVFLSHAKADLPEPSADDADPVRCILAELSQGPVNGWYDAKMIPRGGLFPEEVTRGVVNSSVLIAVLTNSWSSRQWCRREMLEAKEARRPILVVDHITGEHPRLFPYLGNVPVLRWHDSGSASGVVTYAVREALRYRHQAALLGATAEVDDVVFGTMPELMSVSGLPASTRRVIYPDPPIGREEILELQRRVPSIDVVTPLFLLAREAATWRGARIALSLSDAQDAARFGGSPQHLGVLADDLNLYMLLAGLRIAYGGTLEPSGLTPGEINYTERLFGLAKSYSPLSEELGGDGLEGAVCNYVGWPIHRSYGDAELAKYGTVASLVQVGRPDPLGVDQGALGVPKDEFFPPTTAARRFAWARGMTAMREAMRDAPDIVAHVVLGGKLSGYVGRYAGVLEEVLVDLRVKHPIYLVGTLGGAARLAYDALLGAPREELTSAWIEGTEADGKPRYPFYTEVRARHAAAGVEMKTPEELATELASLGSLGLAQALNNGLDDAENHELALATDPRRIVQLVLTGLTRLRGPQGGP